MSMPPPLPLEPGETLVMSGGRGWHAWLFTIVLMPMLCAFVPLFALPWLFSGRYWLTQRRLIFKTPLGKPQVMLLKELKNLEVVGKRATLSLQHPGGTITMRFIEDFHRVWGAILLLAELPVPTQLGAPQVHYRVAPSTLTFPGGFQAGYGVSFNRQLVFLPNERPRNTVAEGAKIAGQLALALVGVHMARYQAKLPFDVWLGLWRHLSTAEFDALLSKTAALRGGRVLPLENLEHESPTLYRAGELKLRAATPLFS
ncbi:MAG: hypothetical protein QM817_30245 [Archangium sp.]